MQAPLYKWSVLSVCLFDTSNRTWDRDLRAIDGFIYSIIPVTLYMTIVQEIHKLKSILLEVLEAYSNFSTYCILNTATTTAAWITCLHQFGIDLFFQWKWSSAVTGIRDSWCTLWIAYGYIDRRNDYETRKREY